MIVAIVAAIVVVAFGASVHTIVVSVSTVVVVVVAVGAIEVDPKLTSFWT